MRHIAKISFAESWIFFSAVILSLSVLVKIAVAEEQRPNFLIVTFDDLQWQSLGYLNPEAKKYTPALTEFSKGARAFLHSHVSYSLCTAARASMMTGMSPLRTGVTAHQVPVESGVITIPEYLKGLDYRTGLIGKVRHTIPFRHDAFDVVVGPDRLAMGRSPEAFHEEVSNFLSDQEEAKPFFLNVNIHDPHTPYPGFDRFDNFKSYIQYLTDRSGLASLLGSARLEYQGTTPGDPIGYDPETVDVYPFLPSLPGSKHEMAAILTAIKRADNSFSRIIEALKDSGHDDDTMIFVLSDNGAALPFSKQNVYVNSTRMGLMIHAPQIPTARELDDQHLVSITDLFPTIIESLGFTPPFNMNGRSLLPLLQEKTDQSPGHDSWREYLMTFYQADYPMRSLISLEWGYKFNAWSDGKQQARAHWFSSETFAAMKNATKKSPEIADRVEHLLYRSKEEFYDLTTDSEELINLVGEKDYKSIINHHRDAMITKLIAQKDPLADEYCDYLNGAEYSSPIYKKHCSAK